MTDGEPETVVSASLQKIKLIKNPIKHFVKKNCFIKSETSVSFVNHFDGHFAYLKTLDFYFKYNIGVFVVIFKVWPCLHSDNFQDIYVDLSALSHDKCMENKRKLLSTTS